MDMAYLQRSLWPDARRPQHTDMCDPSVFPSQSLAQTKLHGFTSDEDAFPSMCDLLFPHADENSLQRQLDRDFMASAMDPDNHRRYSRSPPANRVSADVSDTDSATLSSNSTSFLIRNHRPLKRSSPTSTPATTPISSQKPRSRQLTIAAPSSHQSPVNCQLPTTAIVVRQPKAWFVHFDRSLNEAVMDWSAKEKLQQKRRLIVFHPDRDFASGEITIRYDIVPQHKFSQNDITVSCIYWLRTNSYYLTSVDFIYCVESIVGVPFCVEEKNRIRRNMETFRPITVSKGRSESNEFFKTIMQFSDPKPRNIEKDVKVFNWEILEDAITKIVGKWNIRNGGGTSTVMVPTASLDQQPMEILDKDNNMDFRIYDSNINQKSHDNTTLLLSPLSENSQTDSDDVHSPNTMTHSTTMITPINKRSSDIKFKSSCTKKKIIVSTNVIPPITSSIIITTIATTTNNNTMAKDSNHIEEYNSTLYSSTIDKVVSPTQRDTIVIDEQDDMVGDTNSSSKSSRKRTACQSNQSFTSEDDLLSTNLLVDHHHRHRDNNNTPTTLQNQLNGLLSTNNGNRNKRNSASLDNLSRSKSRSLNTQQRSEYTNESNDSNGVSHRATKIRRPSVLSYPINKAEYHGDSFVNQNNNEYDGSSSSSNNDMQVERITSKPPILSTTQRSHQRRMSLAAFPQTTSPFIITTTPSTTTNTTHSTLATSDGFRKRSVSQPTIWFDNSISSIDEEDDIQKLIMRGPHDRSSLFSLAQQQEAGYTQLLQRRTSSALHSQQQQKTNSPLENSLSQKCGFGNNGHDYTHSSGFMQDSLAEQLSNRLGNIVTAVQMQKNQIDPSHSQSSGRFLHEGLPFSLNYSASNPLRLMNTSQISALSAQARALQMPLDVPCFTLPRTSPCTSIPNAPMSPISPELASFTPSTTNSAKTTMASCLTSSPNVATLRDMMTFSDLNELGASILSIPFLEGAIECLPDPDLIATLPSMDSVGPLDLLPSMNDLKLIDQLVNNGSISERNSNFFGKNKTNMRDLDNDVYIPLECIRRQSMQVQQQELQLQRLQQQLRIKAAQLRAHQLHQPLLRRLLEEDQMRQQRQILANPSTYGDGVDNHNVNGLFTRSTGETVTESQCGGGGGDRRRYNTAPSSFQDMLHLFPQNGNNSTSPIYRSSTCNTFSPDAAAFSKLPITGNVPALRPLINSGNLGLDALSDHLDLGLDALSDHLDLGLGIIGLDQHQQQQQQQQHFAPQSFNHEHSYPLANHSLDSVSVSPNSDLFSFNDTLTGLTSTNLLSKEMDMDIAHYLDDANIRIPVTTVTNNGIFSGDPVFSATRRSSVPDLSSTSRIPVSQSPATSYPTKSAMHLGLKPRGISIDDNLFLSSPSLISSDNSPAVFSKLFNFGFDSDTFDTSKQSPQVQQSESVISSPVSH